MSMSIIYSLVNTPDNTFVTVFAPGRDPLPASQSHPNFDAIVGACEASRRGEDVDVDQIADLFDIATTVARKFARLSERVTVDADGIKLDGDLVHGTLQEQILDFLDAGQDFGPLVKFYENLTTNPLGDVREGLYDWIKGQTANGGKLSISEDGCVLGYKSVASWNPEWRKDVGDTVYVPSRVGPGVVNGVDTPSGKYIEQVPGDVVEMPRSKVLNAPSRACGDGLHIGTYQYASGFYGDTVLLVKFNPRDIVSLPDNNATWKLRVCRYTVIGPVTEPLDVPVFLTSEPVEDDSTDLDFDNGEAKIGDRLEDRDGDQGTLVASNDGYGDFDILYDDANVVGGDGRLSVDRGDIGEDKFFRRIHGKGGATSQAAKGNGRNPAQDNLGRFSAGRPGSARDASTGRFAR